MAAYSVPQEATSLLRKLVTDARLEIPQQVVDIAQDVQYVGSDLPLLRTRSHLFYLYSTV